MTTKGCLLAAALIALGSCYLPPPANQNYPSPQPAPEQAQPTPQYTAPPPQAQYQPPEGGDYVPVDVDPPEESAPTVDVFNDALAPYGRWQNDAQYGRIWYPSESGYQPYHKGYWQQTDYGWTWISDEPFGWAVTHYGRWIWNGRWAWVPDTTWGPAWVEWRESEGYVGWAPLPPDRGRVSVPEERWHFVPAQQLTRVDLPSVYAHDGRTIFRSSRPVTRYTRTTRGEVFIAGPDPQQLRARYNIIVVPSALPPRMTGRYQPDAWRDRGLREQRRRAEEQDWQRQRAEQQRVQAEQLRIQQEQQRLEGQRRQQDEQMRRARDESERRRIEVEQRRAEEQQRQLEAQRQQQEQQQRRFAEDQRRQQEQQRQQQEQQRKAQEEQGRRQQLEQQRQQQEQQRKAQEEQGRRQQFEQQRQEQEQQRKAQEEQGRRQLEQQRQQQEQQRKAQEEQRRRDEQLRRRQPPAETQPPKGNDKERDKRQDKEQEKEKDRGKGQKDNADKDKHVP